MYNQFSEKSFHNDWEFGSESYKNGSGIEHFAEIHKRTM